MTNYDLGVEVDKTGYALMLAILKKIADLEVRLEAPKAQLSVSEAIKGYRVYLMERTKRPENYDYLLKVLTRHFGDGRKIAEITAEELEAFIGKHWPDKAARQRLTQLKGFFNFAILYQRRKNLPVFFNPCELITYKPKPVDLPIWIPLEEIGKVLRSLTSPSKLLIFSISLSAGLRVSEILRFTPADISGRVLTIRQPKSGRAREYAVIPSEVASYLAEYIADKKIGEGERIFSLSRQGVNNFVVRAVAAQGLRISIHYLRKWCATFWDRLGDPAMSAFVLRHSSGSLKDRYVAPLTIEEALNRQDKYLSPLFENLLKFSRC